jgi:hypothetical protein
MIPTIAHTNFTWRHCRDIILASLQEDKTCTEQKKPSADLKPDWIIRIDLVTSATIRQLEIVLPVGCKFGPSTVPGSNQTWTEENDDIRLFDKL